MTPAAIVQRVRETLMDWGVVARPRFYMKRVPVGSHRDRLAGAGKCRRIRRTSLRRMLDNFEEARR